jgi:predicted house-cleaning NTP pyrophosphatase (Maf/HAM1 superfamily)
MRYVNSGSIRCRRSVSLNTFRARGVPIPGNVVGLPLETLAAALQACGLG